MKEGAVYPSLLGKRVIVSGGGSGIGAAMVEAFAGQGARTAFVDVETTASEMLCSKLGDCAFPPEFRLCDITDTDRYVATLGDLFETIGGCDVLVNNAARDDRHGWEDVTPDYYDERIATNLRHMFFAIQAVAPDMVAAGRGSIINMGSNSWWGAGGGMPVYTTAKAAVHGMTRSFARDLGPHRIRVNTVVPGWVMTERQKQLWVTPEKLEAQLRRQCLPDPIDPVYLARMVLFLASDDSAMCTANNFMVEAGSI